MNVEVNVYCTLCIMIYKTSNLYFSLDDFTSDVGSGVRVTGGVGPLEEGPLEEADAGLIGSC